MKIKTGGRNFGKQHAKITELAEQVQQQSQRIRELEGEKDKALYHLGVIQRRLQNYKDGSFGKMNMAMNVERHHVNEAIEALNKTEKEE